MTLFKLSATRGLLSSLSHCIIPQFLQFVRWSWRNTTLTVDPATQALLAEGKPVIYALWHGRMFTILGGFPTERPTILISQSRDGEFITQVAKGIGFTRFIRGGHRRGGALAAKAMIRELNEHRHSLLVLADGPRGPRERIKPGMVKIAASAGVPIVPVSGGCGLLLKVFAKAWDQYRAPFFFSPMTVILGPPLTIDSLAVSDDTVLAHEQERVETALQSLTAQADGLYPNPVKLLP